MFTEEDYKFMRHAIYLAKKGEGFTNPNPLVGSVIVKDGKIIGEGFHKKYGELHAEREALKNCLERKNNPEGATLYVTLEPCCHFGKQPPCTQAIIQSGIKKVIVGSRDPNPLVSGKGNKILRENNITVFEDCLISECDSLNEIFFHYIKTSLPFIALKFASTLDGKIATKDGNSKWITNEESRYFVHSLRNKYSAILCGINTVLQDNPLLTCRIPNSRNPVRIILDSNLKIPENSKIVETASEVKTIVSCTNSAFSSNSEKIKILESAGIEILPVSKDKNARINLQELVQKLAEKKIDSILVEGGASVNYSFLESSLVNKIYAFFAPKIFGGKAKSPVSGDGISKVEEAFSFQLKEIKQFSGDILLEFNK